MRFHARAISRPAAREKSARSAQTSIGGSQPDIQTTAAVQARYSRIARFYDLFEWPVERLLWAGFRERLFARVRPCRILEVGVGTGRNLPYYPAGADLTAIDISREMLRRAGPRAAGMNVRLMQMDAQALAFEDESFRAVVGTFVFCSVPDPVLGLREARRVCRLSGRLLLLEHVRPGGRLLGGLFDLLNPVARRTIGPEISRRTVENVERAGWRIQFVDNLLSDVVKLIVANA